jgi:hypothetical protein
MYNLNLGIAYYTYWRHLICCNFDPGNAMWHGWWHGRMVPNGRRVTCVWTTTKSCISLFVYDNHLLFWYDIFNDYLFQESQQICLISNFDVQVQPLFIYLFSWLNISFWDHIIWTNIHVNMSIEPKFNANNVILGPLSFVDTSLFFTIVHVSCF